MVVVLRRCGLGQAGNLVEHLIEHARRVIKIAEPLPMSGNVIVAQCPSCSQKYRIPQARVGHRAKCKNCGQIFKILEEPPIDDDTVFGWVTHDDPASQSVMGATGVFGARFNAATQVPVQNGWVHPTPPDDPRVRFETVDDEGAVFSFDSSLLRESDLRCSFPHRCAQCLSRDDLEIHLLVWLDKIPVQDAAQINESETRSHRSLLQLKNEHGLGWFDALEPVVGVPAPYHLPFCYCICPQCSVIGAVRCRVEAKGDVERCRLIITHPAIALEFYRNNGGRNAPGYQKLLVAARQRRDNQWKALAVGVRQKLSQWYKPRSDERFLGYYADRDFDSERGSAGLVLTDKRIVYKKFHALREYSLERGGVIDIDATRSRANIEIVQKDQRDAILSTTPLVASALARTLNNLKKPWQIDVSTHEER